MRPRHRTMPDDPRTPSVGFPPLAARGTQLLILGSLPSQESLAKRQYYAHPRNAFWPIMGELFGAGPDLPYAHRIETLMRSGIAVWDVLASTVRPGSLDASIRPETAKANDFAAFFKRYPDIENVFFNGRKAQQLFDRLVVATALRQYSAMRGVLLPSTSPAHAAMSFAAKLQAWSVLRSAARASHQNMEINNVSQH